MTRSRLDSSAVKSARTKTRWPNSNYLPRELTYRTHLWFRGIYGRYETCCLNLRWDRTCSSAKTSSHWGRHKPQNHPLDPPCITFAARHVSSKATCRIFELGVLKAPRPHAESAAGWAVLGIRPQNGTNPRPAYHWSLLARCMPALPKRAPGYGSVRVWVLPQYRNLTISISNRD